jgi:hypothetical protein
MNIKSLTNAIVDFSRKNNLEILERRRLLDNLQTIYRRLIKRDFQKYGYSENRFDIPNRANEFFTELEFQALLGKTWECILKEININSYSHVVDLCPGYSPKIELGLFYLQYKGEVVAIDGDSHALSMLVRFMDLFNPQFKISKKIVNLFGRFKGNYDVVLANHIIDDLVLCYFSQKLRIKHRDIYSKEENVKIIWKHVLSDKKTNLDMMSTVISKMFNQLIEPKGIICITHYKSYFDKLLDADKAYKFNQELLKKIVAELKHNGFSDDKDIVKRAFEKKKGHFGVDNCIVLRK